MLAQGAASYIQQLATTRSDDQDPLLLLSRTISDLETVRIARVDEVQMPLLLLLRRFRTRKSSDSRDKTFALLGLTTSLIKPDYKLTVDEAMLETAIKLICESRCLDSLVGTVIGPGQRHSWATDWS